MSPKITPGEIEKIRGLQMVFILGKDRSGTTLLQTALNKHPSITAPPESKFMMVLYPRFSRIGRWNEKDINRFTDEIYKYPLFERMWHVDREVLTSYLLSSKENLDYALACKMVYYLVKKDRESTIIISDKNPDYALFIDKLIRLFPNAKFIHIVREPKDNVLSRLKLNEGTNVMFNAYKWLFYNKAIEEQKQKRASEFFSVIYEQFAEKPEVILQNLCQFLKITFNSEMLNRKMPDEIAEDKDRMKVVELRHKNLFTPISTSSIGKWKTEMKPYAITMVEKVTGGYANKKYGYDENAGKGNGVSIAPFKLLKGKCIYLTWQAFTRFRYRSYTFNKIYCGLRKKLKGDKILPWSYY